MMKLLLAGGRIIDPSQNLDAHMDILIQNGKISEIGKNIHKPKTDSRKSAAREINIIDVKGMVVVPGLIDMHTHCANRDLNTKKQFRREARPALPADSRPLPACPTPVRSMIPGP